MMENRLQNLLRRLALLGYRPHEINRIVRSANGNDTDLVGHLERYAQLGLHFVNNYSR